MKRSAAILAPVCCSTAVLVTIACSGCAQERTTAHEAPPQVELALASEPGERLVFSGTLSDTRGRPVPGADILAYHQDAQGLYSSRLRARFRTGMAGGFRLNTIVPGGTVRAGEPPHIHFEVEARGHGRQQLTTYLVLDRQPGEAPAPTLLEQPPPLLPDPLKPSVFGLGIAGGAPASRDTAGVWRATANLVVQ